ncbi:response regulator [Vibrio aestuarianus]|uniref:Response regulator n=1 Tax=Vibrio aestuarianus TaxID=28171 RepID=A0A9X4FBG5_9VIBR|nr:response regulator [Vibrio aestuarianus]MDE1234964.1 response regulator [Vibrio aestuarianus]MDE1245815.1 response regulator [Vibrio aestuarianus]MDE1325730.1 response regulator [Vibrio aestuarianus]MDE1346820.1 response regulator [Vibrio aestuarianus]NGZ63166.1 response regulator [Vibrio aestuarianus subsp. cardii]
MQARTRIVVVDDDKEIRELLDEYLTKSGYEIITLADGVALLSYLEQNTYPDLILLDVMMPGDDGFTLCQKIRRNSNVPIIMLTAVSDETDQIIGLEIGADDYVAKPFSPRQLMARIKALLRRVQVSDDKPTDSPSTKQITFGDWQLDTLSHRIMHLERDEGHDLSGSDFALLMLFLTHPNEVLDRDTISHATRGREALPYERGIDVQLSRLRQRLGDSAKYPHYIKTMRGNGYILSVPVTYGS